MLSSLFFKLLLALALQYTLEDNSSNLSEFRNHAGELNANWYLQLPDLKSVFF